MGGKLGTNRCLSKLAELGTSQAQRLLVVKSIRHMQQCHIVTRVPCNVSVSLRRKMMMMLPFFPFSAKSLEGQSKITREITAPCLSRQTQQSAEPKKQAKCHKWFSLTKLSEF